MRGQADFATARTNEEPGALTDEGTSTKEPGDSARRAVVSKTYTELLAQLRKAQALEDAATQKAHQAAPATGAAAGPGTAPGAGTASATNLPGTKEAPRGAAAARRSGIGPGGRSTVGVIPLQDEPTSVLRAGQHVQPLTSLTDIPTGGQPTSFDQQMQRGEAMLKAGKYLEAVDVYDQALGVQPENALAVIGRAHAELAGGMYISAAYDLKSAFTRHPQMVSVRYALADFIPTKRLNMVFADLLALTTQEKGGDTASFLYCYVAYNTGHQEELKNELARWEIRAAHDNWQTIAAKAWGE